MLLEADKALNKGEIDEKTHFARKSRALKLQEEGEALSQAFLLFHLVSASTPDPPSHFWCLRLCVDAGPHLVRTPGLPPLHLYLYVSRQAGSFAFKDSNGVWHNTDQRAQEGLFEESFRATLILMGVAPDQIRRLTAKVSYAVTFPKTSAMTPKRFAW